MTTLLTTLLSTPVTAPPSLGILFPAALLQHEWFAVLSAFVAINTIMYTALAIAKILPKIYLSDLWNRRDRRLTNRSIHPTPEEQASTSA